MAEDGRNLFKLRPAQFSCAIRCYLCLWALPSVVLASSSPSVEANWPLAALGLCSISLAALKEFLLVTAISWGQGGGRCQSRLAWLGPHAQWGMFISGAKLSNQPMKCKVDPDKLAESRVPQKENCVAISNSTSR